MQKSALISDTRFGTEKEGKMSSSRNLIASNYWDRIRKVKTKTFPG